MDTETTKRRHFEVVDVESKTVVETFRTRKQAERFIVMNAMKGAKWLTDNTYEPGTDAYGSFMAMITNALIDSFEVREVG